jgi:hypothetical protein
LICGFKFKGSQERCHHFKVRNIDCLKGERIWGV